MAATTIRDLQDYIALNPESAPKTWVLHSIRVYENINGKRLGHNQYQLQFSYDGLSYEFIHSRRGQVKTFTNANVLYSELRKVTKNAFITFKHYEREV